VALEKEEIFREALSLRIGLRFKDSLRSGERPNLSIRTLESIRKDELQDIGLVVMNPPFIRGIDSVNEKKKLANLIEQNNLSNSRLTGDQLGYECGYLELLISLVPEQTVVAMIFPKNALLRPDSSDLREFLIKDFGLKRIVLYKDTNIFGSVQKSTVILIGIKGSKTETIDYYNYHIDLTEVDTGDNGEIFTKKESVQPAFSVVEIKISELLATSKVGWKSFLSESESQYEASLQSVLECGSFETLDTSHKLFRGSIGNLGASEFLFNPRTTSRDSLESPPQKWRDIPGDWVLPAVKNSDSVPREITSDKGESAIHFPDEAPNKRTLETVIAFLQESNGLNILKKTTSGAQRKKSKSPEDLLEILKSSKPIRGPLVLIPRGQRALAQISFSSEPELLVSTNFFVAECKTRSEAIILSSWLLSVFGQLQFEHSGINQEGMRKLEKLQIEKCLIPSDHYFSEVELCELERVLNDSEPLSFRNIIAREIDIIWAKKLSQEGWQKLIDSVTKTLQQMCVERLNS
jgi:hypothetical protein